MAEKILLSGIQPSGKPHIGNYFGSMRQVVENAKDHDSFVMIADYHALHTVQNGEELRQNILNLAIDYLAIGLDPEKVTLFKQSDISEHTELAWIFDTITTMPYLMRAHAFKDAEAKNKEISVGTFNYPVLMAADILLYGPDVVPVGKDQKQHVEIARDTAEKFNRIYGETFKLPEAMIPEDVATVPGLDGQKMSKSYGNTIPLFASDEEIDALVMKIVTDSGSEIPQNVYAIHALFDDEASLSLIYQEKKGKYKELKEALAADIKAFMAPLREKRAYYASNPELVKQILADGAKKAKAVASKKMEEVRKNIGVTL